MATPVTGDDLSRFGYRQELRRSLGSFSTFAAGFSFVSVLTTVFQLFAFGYAFGGTLFFWTWPVVLLGQTAVALTFAELAARIPLAGSVYQWSKWISGGFLGWLGGWTMLVGCVVALASAAMALQVVLPSVWSGFQVVGGDPGVTTPTGAMNSVVLGVALLGITTALNASGVRVMARVNDAAVAAELMGVAVLVVGLAVAARRGPDVVLANTGPTGEPVLFGGLLASALMAAYVLYGFDTAASVAEETKDAARRTPKGMIRALLVSGVAGMAVVLLALMAAPALTDGRLAGEGLPGVVTFVLGDSLARVFLADVAIAIAACALAIQTAAIRLVYSMARDGALPRAGKLSAVNERTGAPLNAVVLTGCAGVALLLVNLGNSAIFSALTATSVVTVYLSYLLVTGPLMVRGRGTAPLRRRGLRLVNVIAVCYGLAMLVNIGWPRAEIYDLAGTGSWWTRMFAWEFVAAVLVVGWLCWRRLVPGDDAARLPAAVRR